MANGEPIHGELPTSRAEVTDGMATTADKPETGGLAIAALAVGAAGGISHLFNSSVGWSWAIAIVTVLATAMLMAIDLSRLPMMDANGKVREHAGVMFLGMCLLWVAVFPYSYFIRRRFVRPDWSYVAVAVVLFFLAAPFLKVMLMPVGLPACDSPEVMHLIDKVVRGGPQGAKVTGIDGFREVEHDADADQRLGTCVVHTTEGDVEVNFIVSWRDRDARMFEVRIPSPELPLCTSPEVMGVLEQLVRGLPAGAQLESITGHREVSYDAEAGRREGACDVQLGGETQDLKFVVQWRDRDQGMFEVQILP